MLAQRSLCAFGILAPGLKLRCQPVTRCSSGGQPFSQLLHRALPLGNTFPDAVERRLGLAPALLALLPFPLLFGDADLHLLDGAKGAPAFGFGLMELRTQ